MSLTTPREQALDALQDAQVTPPLVAAHELLDWGYSVIPIAPQAKTPPRRFPLKRYGDGVEHATHAELDTWRKKWPDGNIGVLCGTQHGLMVLDLDGASAVAVAEAFGLPDNAPRVRTARGLHVYFQCPKWLNTSYTGKGALWTLKDGSRIEVKATGYVVAPPSMHPDGVLYTAEVPLSTPRPEAPAWLLERLHELRKRTKQPPATKNDTNGDGTTSTTAGAVAATYTTTSTADATTPETHTGDGNNNPFVLAVKTAIAQALGVERYNERGWSNNVHCPFHHDQHPSATWNAHDGALVCHAGCRPNDGRRAFGWLETATALGINLDGIRAQVRNTPPEAPERPGTAQNTVAGIPTHLVQKLHPQKKGGESPFSPPFNPPLRNGLRPLGTTPPDEAKPGGKPELRSFRSPPILNYFTGGEDFDTNSKKGKKARQYVLRIPQELDGLSTAISKAALSTNQQYRAFAYSLFRPGRYTRQQLAQRVDVSRRTTRVYDKLASVVVTPNPVKRTPISAEAEARLPLERTGGWKWLESTAGYKYPYTRLGLRRAIAESVEHSGQALAYVCKQPPNNYTPPEYGQGRVGLPDVLRIELVRHKLASAARVLDALLLGGIRPGEAFTARQAIEIGARYGLSASTVRRALRKLAVEQGGGHAEQ